jgi:hypothetical protein
MAWEKLSGDFVESDVVEWTEAIWPPNTNQGHSRRRKKSRPWGKQKIIAQIIATEGDFLKLTILKSAITENLIGSELKPSKIGSTITKKCSTLLRGEPERLLWSEEDVRTALLTHPQFP